MPGGLIQLLTIGLQDAPLVLNPEITFWKTTHRRHTNFSIEQINKNIGPKKFNTFFQYKLNNVTDLLAGFHFIIDIPYFDVLKKVISTSTSTSTLEINELSILFDNVKTYLLYDISSKNYYLAPETFFNLSKNDEFYNQVSGYDLEKNLLAGYNIINAQDYGNIVNVLALKSSELNQILPVLRLYYDQFKEFWLRIFDETSDINYYANIKSQLSLVTELRDKLDLILYDGYVNYNVFNKFRQYLNFKDEIINFLIFDEITTTNPIYDSDFAKNYAIEFNLNINTYKYNALKFNSLLYLFFIQSLYPDFSNKIKAYTFWKKFTLGIKNKVEETLVENNYFLEWKNKINLYQNTSFGNFGSIQSQIYEIFTKKYFSCEQRIKSLFTSLNILNEEKTWCILQTFYQQFTNNTNNIICFDDHFNPNTSSTLNLNYNIKRLFENTYQNLLSTSNLNSSWTNFDDSNYVQPVDLGLIYPYMSYRFLDDIINLNYFDDDHFMVLWRNKITIAFFFRLAEILDNYYSEKTNDNTFQNTFLDLNDYGKALKNLTFYYNINLNRNIRLDNLRYEMNQLFDYECFYGSINIQSNDLSSNFILVSPSYTGLENTVYDILNQDMTITDEKFFEYMYDLSKNIITIDNWNISIYNKIFIEVDGGFVELFNYKFINNQLLLYPQNILPIKLTNNKILLRLVKEILIPIVNFNPVTDNSGNANFANMSFNIYDYPDISFNLITNKDVSFNSINLFSSGNDIIINNNFEIFNGKLQIKIGEVLDTNKFYELKITDYQYNIDRKVIYLDDNKNIIPNIELDFNKIDTIDLIDYNLNLNLLETDVSINNNIIDLSGHNENAFYWLLASLDVDNNLLPKNIFLPVKFSGADSLVLGDISNYHWDLYTVENSLVPNLFPILSHYNNRDASNNLLNYQLNSYFYQKPFIIETYHQYLATDESGNLIDQSFNLIDNSGNVVDQVGNRIILDGSGAILDYVFDESGNKIINTGDYILEDPSGNLYLNSEPDGSGIDNTDFGIIAYKVGPGLWIKFTYNDEPIYYFYNIPINEDTKEILLNGNLVNKIMPINPCEFYIDNSNNRIPVIYDPLNQNKNITISKKEIINQYNIDFDKIFKQDENFSNLISLIENISDLYQNLFLDLIQSLKNLGKTSYDVIDNSVIINNNDLQYYNTFDFDTYSLLTPAYYNLSTTSISTGLGIQKFKIASKGYIVTQLQQEYKSNEKITTDLTNYLTTVSETLISNLNDISGYQDLINVYNQNNNSESYKPLYLLENTLNVNLYDISQYKVTTLFDLSGNYSNSNNLIYFNNTLIDISTNNIASGESLIEISEQHIYKTEVIENNINDFKKGIFNYIGPIHFEKDNFVFYDNYNLINDSNNCYILLDDKSIVKLSDNPTINIGKVNFNSYEFTLTNPEVKITSSELYVYDLIIDVSNNTETITGNSMIINFDLYQFQKVDNHFIVKGTKPLEFKNKYLICGNSQGTIETFVPINFILARNITIYNNLKTNLYFSGNTNNKIAYSNDNYLMLDRIRDISLNYYSIYSDASNVTIYDISNSNLIPPFILEEGTIKLSNDSKDFIINNFYDAYYYKLNNDIVRGDKLKDLDISGNFNLWIYPDANLKLIDTGKNADISNNNIYFSSIENLPNYTYYFIDDYIYYVDIVQNIYPITNVLKKNSVNKKLYYLDDTNFNLREEQYISIIDASSNDIIVPNVDFSSNNIYSNESGISSYYSFDYKNKNNIIFDNEVDLLVAFKDPSGNNFMKPFSYNYDINNNCQPLYVIRNSKNYYNFFFYKESDLSNNYVSGFLDSNNTALELSCNDDDFVIDSSFNFTLKGSSGFKKYKIFIKKVSGDFYSTIFTLKIDSSNTNYDSIFNMLGVDMTADIYNPENVWDDQNWPPPLYIENRNQTIVQLNTGYSLLGTNPLIIRDVNNYVKFANVSSNSIRKQIYYHSNILLKNKLVKLNLDYDPSWDIFPDLDYLGVTVNINGNVITTEKTVSNINYLIFINNKNVFYRELSSIDLSNNILYLDTELENDLYNIYASTRKIMFNKNVITLYYSDNEYKITSYERKSFRIGDIILLGDNIFKIRGLNSFTNFYDLIDVKVNYQNVKSTYYGYYLLYRLNSTPKLPEVKVTDFTLNDYNNYKMTIDSSYNIFIDTSSNNFSVKEGENILLYVNRKQLYNCFNYQLNPYDYLIYNSTLYRIKTIKDGIVNIVLNTNLTTIIDLGVSEGFYSFYVPYQPCLMRNVIFDSSGNINVNKENAFGNLYFYEVDGQFTNSLTNTANTKLYTRVIIFPEEYYYFQNKSIRALDAIIYNNVLTFDDDISDYDFYYNQHIKIDSYINHIRKVTLPNMILLKDTIYDISKNVKVYFGVKNSKEIFSNYKLDKSVSSKPYLNLSKYHICDFSDNQLINYDISNNYDVSDIDSGRIVFQDNVLNVDLSNNMANLDNSYHILLEKTIYNQYISHICQLKLPNHLFLYTNVENYNSEFYFDKVYPIILNVDNSFSFKNQKIIKQTLIPKLPYNQIEIWRKYDLILVSAVENLTNGYRVEIDVTEFIDVIDISVFYIDRTIECSIVLDNSKYYLVTKDYLDKFEYIYTKEINYLTSSTKYNYTDIIKINPYFEKENTIEKIKIPTELTYVTDIDYYYYSLTNDIDLLINNDNLNLSAGLLNLNVNDYYIDTVIDKRVLTTPYEMIDTNSLYLNDNKTNLFDDNRIYLDGDASITNIFKDTNFLQASLFNPIKTWAPWSLLGSPDISDNLLSKGNFYVDISKNVTRDTSGIYFTKSEERDISNYLTKIHGNYNTFLDLKKLQEKLYLFLPWILKYEVFWEDPKTYINTFISDNGYSFYFDGTDFILNNNKITYLVLNNQYDLSFNAVTQKYRLTRNFNLANNEIFNLLYNNYDDHVYGVKLTDVIKHLITMGEELKEFKEYVFSFSGKCVNFVDLTLNILKNLLYGNIQDFDEQYRKLQNSLSVDNFSIRGLDVTVNEIFYDTSFNTDACLYYKDYPSNPTQKLYQSNIPVDINYQVDTSAGLYPYKITITDENYIDYTIYKLDFLEDEFLKKIISIDYPIVYNNQIEFFARNNFDINHEYSICSYKTYDFSSNSLLGYAYQLDLDEEDLNVLDMTKFSLIKYKNMELTTFKTTFYNYLIFPKYIDNLTSYIHTEMNVAVEKSNVTGDTTYITLLKINQTLNATSSQYTIYFSTNNKQYRVDDVFERDIRVRGVISEFIDTKLILSIKPTSVAYKNLYLYQLNLTKPLTNYSYYFDLPNVPKNFAINDIVYPKDLIFVGDDILNVLIKTSDISSGFKFENIVHYAKVGEFPPEPIKQMNKYETYLYEFYDKPPIANNHYCFLVTDPSYNSYDPSGYLTDFLQDISSYPLIESTDVLIFDNYIQFVVDRYITDTDLHDHTFGGVINQWELVQYTYDTNEKKLRFKPFPDFVWNKDYHYYINERMVDISDFFFFQPTTFLLNGGVDTGGFSGNTTGQVVSYPLTWTEGYIEMDVLFDASWNNIIFKQVIIQQQIYKPANNQLADLILFDPIDVRFDGYIQTLDENGNEIGNYIYLLDIDISHNFTDNTTIYFNSENIIEGKVMLGSPFFVVTFEKLSNVKSIYIPELNQNYENFTYTYVQDAFFPFTLYKKIALEPNGTYKVFVREKELNFLEDFIFNRNNLNKFYLISKFAKFKLEKRFYSEIITPSPELLVDTSSNTVITQTTEKVKFKDNLYRLLFNYIEFYIGDQLVEELNKDTMEMQYQFLKDVHTRKKFDLVVKPYDSNGKLRLIIPLEFWFNGENSLYLPLLSLMYTPIFIKFKIDEINNLITNGPKNSTKTITYSLQKVPEINIELNIDGIILDNPERELFGNNSHEYIIERFIQYPDSLIDTVNGISRMKFKNLVKDIFFSTEIISTKEKTYITEKIIRDKYQEDYVYKRALYTLYLQIGAFTDVVKKEFVKDYDYLRISINDINTNAERYLYFKQSALLSKFNMEMLLYFDLKYQQTLPTLEYRRHKLELYCAYLYKNETEKKYTSPIDLLNIKTSGTDLFRSIDVNYLNAVVPYEKYFTSADYGYYVYSFALNPTEKQPSGHINFTTLNDVTVNTINKEKVIKDPYILKTVVREYQIIRIMSGMGALAWLD